MRAVGYRQVWQYLDGIAHGGGADPSAADARAGYSEMCAAGIAATRQLAKRQLTWLRNWHDLRVDGSVSLIEQNPFTADGAARGAMELLDPLLKGRDAVPI